MQIYIVLDHLNNQCSKGSNERKEIPESSYQRARRVNRRSQLELVPKHW